MTATTEAGGRLDGAVGSLSRALARRVTRRSALGRIGKYGVALSLGAAGTSLIEDQAWAAASAASGCCSNCINKCGHSQCNDSIYCNYGGYCPPGTCECGAWSYYQECGPGNKGIIFYGDCCGGCGGGANCSCPGGAPHCCNYHEWDNGQCAAYQCQCNSTTFYINCRRSYCSI